MRLTGQEQFGYAGIVLRTTRDELAIFVAQLSPVLGVLVLTDGTLQEIPSATIQKRPAVCLQCHRLGWWWHESDSRPLCLYCVPPDAEWKASTLQKAEAFVMRFGQESASAKRVIDACLSHGGRAWAGAQKLAFFERMPGLVIGWMARQEQQP